VRTVTYEFIEFTRGRAAKARESSVARQVLVVQLLVLAAGSALAIYHERRSSDAAARHEVTAIAVSVADAASTARAIQSPDPSAQLQPEAERIRAQTGVDFIVVMAPDRTRYTHPNPALIGKPFVGDIDRALSGETFTEVYGGSLGPSTRAVTPVYANGAVIGLVAVGVTQQRLGDQFMQGLPLVLGVATGGLVLAALGALLLGRRLRRQTLGLAPSELRGMYEHHEAVLHSISEGLLVFGTGPGPAEVVNDEARRLLDLPDGPVTRASLPESIRRLSRDPVIDEVHVTPNRLLVVNQEPVRWDGRELGTVLTLRDHTELRGVMGELDSMTVFAESLRAQAHESANRLHAVITLVELGRTEEAVTFATAELELSQHLIDRLMAAVHEPALAALLLGKVSEAAERGVNLTVSDDTSLTTAGRLSPHDLVTVVGNLIDNAVDAAALSAGTQQPWVQVTVRQSGDGLLVRVADSGPGIPAEMLTRATARGYSTKSDHPGLGLAMVLGIVARHGGSIASETTGGSQVLVTLPIAGPS